MSKTLGLGINDGPATVFVPLSGSTASAPAIAITATTATGGGTLVHTAGTSNTDVIVVYVFNNTNASLVAYGQAGTLTSSTALPVTVAGNSYAVLAPQVPISNGGSYGVWTTATTGLMAWGYVARTF